MRKTKTAIPPRPKGRGLLAGFDEYYKKGEGLYLAHAMRAFVLIPATITTAVAVGYIHMANYDSSSVTFKDYATIKTADAEYTGYLTKNPLMDYVEILQIPQYPIILNCENLQELAVCREKPVAINKSDITQLITHKSQAKG